MEIQYLDYSLKIEGYLYLDKRYCNWVYEENQRLEAFDLIDFLVIATSKDEKNRKCLYIKFLVKNYCDLLKELGIQ